MHDSESDLIYKEVAKASAEAVGTMVAAAFLLPVERRCEFLNSMLKTLANGTWEMYSKVTKALGDECEKRQGENQGEK